MNRWKIRLKGMEYYLNTGLITERLLICSYKRYFLLPIGRIKFEINSTNRMFL